ncbi:hypothetical protein V6N13_129989 [Hibiscus sabdariffa]|uniref:Uncharacterized protein n=1 Tax=Hibiscus sabdariffa TaxID=183260 RepID=A0ABR2SMS6_9ROSI
MAGLQYNFFPTDFYYPRPPRVATAVTTIQTPKKEETTTSNNNINDLEWPRSLGFKVHQPQNTNPARLSCSLHPQQHHQIEDQSKYYPNPNPLSLCSFVSEELPDSP